MCAPGSFPARSPSILRRWTPSSLPAPALLDDKTISLDETVAGAHFYLGQLAFDNGYYDTAPHQFDKTILLDPGSATLYMRRGTTL
jgi:hypothetical protein